MTPNEKYKELFRKMMYNISGHSLLTKKNNANRHIVILCDEIQNEVGMRLQFWEDVKSLAQIKSQ